MQRDEVRALVLANQPRSSAGYDDEVKRTVIAYTQHCRAQGQRWEDIGMDIGLSGKTLRHWSQQLSTFLPITIVDTLPQPRVQLPTPVATPSLVLHTPNGFRLDGLDLEQALALLSVLR